MDAAETPIIKLYRAFDNLFTNLGMPEWMVDFSDWCAMLGFRNSVIGQASTRVNWLKNALKELSNILLAKTYEDFVFGVQNAINNHIITPLNNVLDLLNKIFKTDWHIDYIWSGTVDLAKNAAQTAANAGNGNAARYLQYINGEYENERSGVFGGAGANGFGGKYASGGFPPRGDLFIAGEAGAELVSSHNGQTQVSNTDQIAASVQNGNGVVVSAIDAMADAVVRAIANKNTNVYLDSKEIRNGQNRLSRAMG